MLTTPLSGIEILATRIPHFFGPEGEIGKYAYDKLGESYDSEIKSYTNLVALSICSKAMADIRFWKNWNLELDENAYSPPFILNSKEVGQMPPTRICIWQPLYRVILLGRENRGNVPDKYLCNLDTEPAHVPKLTLVETGVSVPYKPRAGDAAKTETRRWTSKTGQKLKYEISYTACITRYRMHDLPDCICRTRSNCLRAELKIAIESAQRVKQGGPGILSSFRARDCCEMHTEDHAKRMIHSPHRLFGAFGLSDEAMQVLRLKCSEGLFDAIHQFTVKERAFDSICICGAAILDALYSKETDKPVDTLDLFASRKKSFKFDDFLERLGYRRRAYDLDKDYDGSTTFPCVSWSHIFERTTTVPSSWPKAIQVIGSDASMEYMDLCDLSICQIHYNFLGEVRHSRSQQRLGLSMSYVLYCSAATEARKAKYAQRYRIRFVPYPAELDAAAAQTCPETSDERWYGIL